MINITNSRGVKVDPGPWSQEKLHGGWEGTEKGAEDPDFLSPIHPVFTFLFISHLHHLLFLDIFRRFTLIPHIKTKTVGLKPPQRSHVPIRQIQRDRLSINSTLSLFSF